LIPIKLSIKNFLCYRKNVPPIDFSGMHVACLCGANGSGKSSIFDAMTWALWGEASRGRSNDELIHSSSNEMEVELEFLSGDDRLRVIRKHTRSAGAKSGQGMLDLQLLSNGSFKSISEHTRTETQDKIIKLLHLDYQTFVNSAMLLQGRANEFSKKRPGERKDILANILDLSFYDQLEQQSRQQAERSKIEAENYEKEISLLTGRIAERPQHEDDREKVGEALSQMDRAKQDLDREISGFRHRKEDLLVKQKQLELIKQQVGVRNSDLQSWQQRLAAAESNIEKIEKLLSRRDEIEKGYAEFKKLSIQEDVLTEKLKKYLELIQRKNKLETLVNSAQNMYTNQLKVLSNRVDELQVKASRLGGLEQQKSQALSRQQELNKMAAGLEAGKKSVTELNGIISTVTTLNSQLTAAADDIRAKLEMISHAGAKCPLCESPLGPDGCARIKKKLDAELGDKIFNVHENEAQLEEHRSELASLEKELKEKDTAFKAENDQIKQQLAVVEKEIADARNAAQELKAAESHLKELEEDIRHKRYAADEQNSLASIERELGDLAYDTADHKQVSQRKAALENFEQLNTELSGAKSRLETEDRQRADSLSAISGLESEIKSLTDQSRQIENELSELNEVTQQMIKLEARQRELQAEDRKLRDRMAELKEKISQLDRAESEKLIKEKSLHRSRDEENIYAELAKDFSKKGIQALIIEESLPEITNEANLLIGKMTDNRMSISLESQRGTKKGDMIETLDIKIADELGTRSYEMYSGGEAFRIDLALRIAISRLLTRKAGAAMPVLIIDEGFGTQDSAGLEKLVEAINSIQDDFDKVFVITHLEELKDKFPVLINVTKTADGSMISVSQ